MITDKKATGEWHLLKCVESAKATFLQPINHSHSVIPAVFRAGIHWVKVKINGFPLKNCGNDGETKGIKSSNR